MRAMKEEIGRRRSGSRAAPGQNTASALCLVARIALQLCIPASAKTFWRQCRARTVRVDVDTLLETQVGRRPTKEGGTVLVK